MVAFPGSPYFKRPPLQRATNAGMFVQPPAPVPTPTAPKVPPGPAPVGLFGMVRQKLAARPAPNPLFKQALGGLRRAAAPGAPAPAPAAPAVTPVTPAQNALAAAPPPARPNVGPNVGPTVPQPNQPREPIDYLSDFGPGNDLRFTQVNPYATERLRGVQGQVTGAAGALSGAPDLTAAAAEKLRLYEEESNPAFQEAVRRVGQKNAAFGRLGSGMAEGDIYGPSGVFTLREQELARQRRGLASDVAFAEGGERRANLGALSGLESQLYGQEAGTRGEVRGERAYQYGAGQDALENRIRQRMLEESLAGAESGRQFQGAEQYGQQAEQGSQTSADLLNELAYQEQLRKERERRGATI